MKKTKLVIVALFAALAVALVTGCQNTASGANENSGTTTQTGGNTSGGTTQTGGNTSGGTTQTGGNTSGGTTQTNLVAGNTYKTTTAKMGNSATTLQEGVNAENYVTLTFAATGNTGNMVGTGPSMEQMTAAYTYTLDGTSITMTAQVEGMGTVLMTGTVSPNGNTITFPAQNVAGMWLSATYVKQ